MKKAVPTSDEELRPEYRREDLGKGVRGKYYEAYYEAYIKGIKEDFPKPSAKRKRAKHKSKRTLPGFLSAGRLPSTTRSSLMRPSFG